MATLAELQAQRDALTGIRRSGILTVVDQNGESVTYKSDAQIAAAIADLDAQIASLTNRMPANILYRNSGRF